MAQTYIFHSPRNLYEKLQRDSEKLEVVMDGDYLFNFISTAHHLQDWIKKSPLKSSTIMKRFLKRLGDDNNLKVCNDIVLANCHFAVMPSEAGCQLKVGDICYDACGFKNEIMELYEVFFKMKNQ